MIKKNRKQILEIAKKHGAINLRIFGSMAHGGTGPKSDIDLLVEVGPHRSPFFPGGMIIELQELLGRKVDVVTKNSLHRYIRNQVLKEAIPL